MLACHRELLYLEAMPLINYLRNRVEPYGRIQSLNRGHVARELSSLHKRYGDNGVKLFRFRLARVWVEIQEPVLKSDDIALSFARTDRGKYLQITYDWFW